MRSSSDATAGPRLSAALLLVLLGGFLGGCGTLLHAAPPALPRPGAVSRAPEGEGRFLAFVGPAIQHASPYLDVSGTNFYTLRSWLDRRTGETAHQLYVTDSYAGAERNWNAARDERGAPLRFIAISKNEITCEGGCAYDEEFAAALPDSVMRAHGEGLAVTFTARSGAEKTIAVAGDLMKKQLAAVDAARAGVPVAAATPPAGR